jgi:hypothetical protein
MRARLDADDYIVGCFRAGRPARAVCAMKVDEVLALDDYYRDARFRRKRPSARNPEGDNVYFKDDDGKYRQDPKARHHRDAEHQRQDVRGDRVFIGEDFVYFGRDAVVLPVRFVPYLPATQGIKYVPEGEHQQLFAEFLKWRATLGSGLRGSPRDAQLRGARGCGQCGRPSKPIHLLTRRSG